MKRTILFLFVFILAVTSAWAYEFLSGSGTVEDPYEVATIEDLNALSNDNTLWDKYFVQTTNIDASSTATLNEGKGFSPIGNNSNKFSGSYNGNNKTISNLYINRSTTSNIGLFSYTNGATISNLGLIDNEVYGKGNTGSLIGLCSNSIIRNCYATGSVSISSISGNYGAGGLVGFSDGSTTMDNCYATGSISGYNWIGGLVGISYDLTVRNCYATAAVNGMGYHGGLLGVTHNITVINCYATGAVADEGYYKGGLIGNTQSGSSISNSFWDKETTGRLGSSGGGTVKTTEEMKTLTTFTEANWDIEGETPDGLIHLWKIDSSKNDGYPYLNPDYDSTLPVTLTSFMAIQTAENYAQITWTSESESSLIGYNVYRNEIDEQGTAIKANRVIIEATNSTLTSSYCFVDENVVVNTTYYYWLQVNEFDGSVNFHGPYQVRIDANYDNEPIVIPTKTTLRNIYPNPFNPSTSVSFFMDKAEVVKLNVYNVRGQLVTNLAQSKFDQGFHNVVWNGEDMKGNACASGIYLFRMESEHNVQIVKGILMK
ncbi:MAG: GLUG motif-containing protein [Candidatus Cloacimonadales bacterium]